MKMEIEFNGQRTDNKEWVYGDLVRIPNGDSFDCYIISDFDERDTIYDLWKYAIKVIPETVGQYTGFTDKNGKKVYEGDILKVERELELWENKTKHETFFGVVEYDEENTRFVTNGKTYKNMPIFIQYNISYEVIGTVFDKESDNVD